MNIFGNEGGIRTIHVLMLKDTIHGAQGTVSQFAGDTRQSQTNELISEYVLPILYI
jgi:hypothetical protein